MKLTEEQILTLAPDEASKKSGKELANPAKWVSKRINDIALWGECQGSGSKPYQTVVDLVNMAFKCSCPSRKFPCKHGIALGLLHARNAQLFSTSEMPAWVAEWITKRAANGEKKAGKEEKEVDPVAQAKRVQARDLKVSEGIEDLLIWIRDIARNGIINIPDKDYAYWNGVAKRLVDAQAAGLANMVKNLGTIPFYKDGWQIEFLERLTSIYLIAKAYQNKDNLSELELHEVRSAIGFTINQAELKEQKGVVDTWLVVGKQLIEEDSLTIERNWLQGLSTNHSALVLQFINRGQGASIVLSPGMHVDAELVYFPTVSPLRAVMKEQRVSQPSHPQRLYNNWNEVAEKETDLYAGFPILHERTYLMKRLLPVQYNDRWWLRDDDDSLTAIKDSFPGLWKLLSLSGGEPLDMAVLGKGQSFEPLGVWIDKTYKTI